MDHTWTLTVLLDAAGAHERMNSAAPPCYFWDLLNGVAAELRLHNLNEFCCVGVCKYTSGYFLSRLFTLVVSLSSGAAAPTDSEVKFHPARLLLQRDGEIDLHG